MPRELVTMVTDYLLGAWTIYLAYSLIPVGRRQGRRSVMLAAAAFFATGIAALVGGTYHGFIALLNPFARVLLWKTTVYSIGCASALFLSAAILATMESALRRWFLIATALKLVAYLGWMTIHDDFRYVIYDYTISMVGVIVLLIAAKARRNEPSAPWVIGGILVSFGAATIQQSGLRVCSLNHNDLYHIVQMVGMWVLYRGMLLLRDRD